MDLVLYFVAVAILIVLIITAVKLRGKTEGGNHEARLEVPAQVVGRQQMAEEGGNRLRHRRNLNRMVANRVANSAQREAADNDSSVEEENEDAEQLFQAAGKIGAKKQKKLEEKQAKRAQREAELEEREERKRMQELREKERREEEKKERILEERQEEEELRAKEEQQKREEEEYQSLKQSFVVEEQGEADELTEQESQNLLQEFIQHIKDCKVVLLEDLASHFGLRTQDAISRLQDLLADGSITGVIDDRGKFIFITPEEMNAVAQFIRQRGRVSITDLAQASNSLISLIPEIHNIA